MSVAAVDLSVVLVNYNTRELLGRTIAAVLTAGASLAVEVVVVDNASADGSAEMVREQFPGVRLLANDHNRFYAPGNNQGIAATRGRYVLVLNPDARPEPGTLEAMVAWMDAHPDAGVMAPLLAFSDGRVQRNCATLRTFEQFLLEYTVWGLLRPGRRRTVLDSHWYGAWDRSTPRDVGVVPGSCMLVRRSVIDQVGAFDERLLMYFTEDDWCLRIAAGGWRVCYAPVGRVVHDESASVVQRRRPTRAIYFRDMVRYTRTHFGPGRALVLRVLAEPTRWLLDLSAAIRGEVGHRGRA